MAIILIMIYQVGLDRLVLRFYMSMTTGSLSLRHPHRTYPSETSGSACQWHWDHSVPHAHLLSGRTRRPQAGCRRRMQDVVCQLGGIGMVPRYVMNGKGAVGTVRHVVLLGERFHLLPCEHAKSPYFGACYRPICTWIFRLCLSKLSIRPTMRLCIVPVVCGGGKYGALPLFRQLSGGRWPKWRCQCIDHQGLSIFLLQWLLVMSTNASRAIELVSGTKRHSGVLVNFPIYYCYYVNYTNYVIKWLK